MYILINDIVQESDAADELKSPDLSDYYSVTNFDLAWSGEKTINCVGIGYTDATQIVISNATESVTINITQTYPDYNGLYLVNSLTTVADYHTLNIAHNGTYLGRLGLGTARKLNTTITKEWGFYSTEENKISAAGGVIPGAGGIDGRRFEADVRYEIDADIAQDIRDAYSSQIRKGFPYFLYLFDEQHKLPAHMLRMYMATDKPQLLLQSSTYEFLYSYKFSFYERF